MDERLGGFLRQVTTQRAAFLDAIPHGENQGDETLSFLNSDAVGAILGNPCSIHAAAISSCVITIFALFLQIRRLSLFSV
jgi:hypothetical protein